MEIPKPVKDGI